MMFRKFILITVLFCTLSYASGAQADSNVIELDEVVIALKIPVKVSGDTVSYTVDSFSNDKNATTEDVLKRLPGIDVSPDGKITVQGKPVTRVFINGKEFSTLDIRTITQNLPAEVLEKIQVADWHSENEQFNAIKRETGEKMLNLEFKQKYRQGIFSKSSAGYGTKDRYQANTFINGINQTSRITAIGNLNNTGLVNAGDNIMSDGANSGITSNRRASLNFFFDKGPKIKLNGSYEFSGNDTRNLQSLFRTTYLSGDSVLHRTQHSSNTTKSDLHHISLRQTYKANDKLNVITDAKLTLRKSELTTKASDTVFYQRNSHDFSRTSLSSERSLSGMIQLSNTLQKKFSKKGRTLQVNVQGMLNDLSRNGLMSYENTYSDPGTNVVTNFDRGENTDNLNAQFGVQYAEPLSSKSTLLVRYGYLLTRSSIKRNINQRSGIPFYDTVQSRFFDTKNMEHPFELTYQLGMNRWNAGCNIEIRPYKRWNTIDTSTIMRSDINYYPGLYASYRFSARSILNIDYRGSITAPDITQLQPIPDYTDSLNIFIGNPDLNPETSHSASIKWNYTKEKKLIWLLLSAGFTNQKIINKIDINTTRRITQPVNANGVYNLNLSLNYSNVLVPKLITGTIGMQSSLARNLSVTNSMLLPVANFFFVPNMRLVMNLENRYEGEVAYSYRYSSLYSAGGEAILQTHTLTNRSTLFLPWNLKASCYVNYVFNNFSAPLERDFILINAGVEKTFKNLSVSVKAFDIFNNYPTVQRITGDNYFEDRSVNRVGSYYILTLAYKFSWFPVN